MVVVASQEHPATVAAQLWASSLPSLTVARPRASVVAEGLLPTMVAMVVGLLPPPSDTSDADQGSSSSSGCGPPPSPSDGGGIYQGLSALAERQFGNASNGALFFFSFFCFWKLHLLLAKPCRRKTCIFHRHQRKYIFCRLPFVGQKKT
jgi:hypothetical protein